MAQRVFIHRLTNDEIQPIEVPQFTKLLEVSWDQDKGFLLHCLADFANTGSVTRFVYITQARDKEGFPDVNLAFINSIGPIKAGWSRAYFFEVVEDVDMKTWESKKK